MILVSYSSLYSMTICSTICSSNLSLAYLWLAKRSFSLIFAKSSFCGSVSYCFLFRCSIAFYKLQEFFLYCAIVDSYLFLRLLLHHSASLMTENYVQISYTSLLTFILFWITSNSFSKHLWIAPTLSFVRLDFSTFSACSCPSWLNNSYWSFYLNWSTSSSTYFFDFSDSSNLSILSTSWFKEAI